METSSDNHKEFSKMRLRPAVPVVLFMTWSAFAPALIAQASANWDSVKQLAAEKEIQVTLMDGRNLRGKFQNATDDALMIATSKSQETLSRAMVTKVSS